MLIIKDLCLDISDCFWLFYASKYNVREEDLHQLAIDAFNDVCTGGNPRPTSVEDIEALYHKAF